MPKKENEFKIDLEEMAKTGMHFGHQTFRLHPKMTPYLAGIRNEIHILDLEKTAEKLREALKFIQEIISQGKVLLIIGTKIQVRDLVKNLAKELNLPYISERWLGGTFTNFETILKRLKDFKDLENKKAQGELEKYTKKERLIFEQKLRELEMKFGGIKNLNKLPDTIFVLDMKKDELAISEAKKKGIKIIGICHTNIDPSLADYPIPANDDSIPSVKYILEKVREAIKNAKLKMQNAKL